MINKNWAFALGILSLSTAIVAADQASQQMDKNPPMPMGVTSQPTGVITPPVAPAVNHGADVYISADFIYWKIYSGVDIGDTGNRLTSTTTSASAVQKMNPGTAIHTTGSFEPGFKVGLGLEFEHDGWDLFAQYTWLAPANNSVTSPAEVSAPNYFNNITYGPGDVSSITGQSHTHYNVVDLEVGRNFFLSRYMTLRPHFGLKADWITRRTTTSYEFLINHSQFGGVLSQQDSNKIKNWGLGIRCGLDPVWHFTRSWGMYGEFALSALYTRTKVKNIHTQYTGAGETGTGYQIFNYQPITHDITQVLELGLGLSYMSWFYDEAYMLEVKAGWEEQLWIGAFAVQGFTFKLGFHF